METRQNNRPLASRLSRSLKVIGTDTKQLITYDFLLVTDGPISHRFRNKRRFLFPCILNGPARGVPLGIS